MTWVIETLVFAAMCVAVLIGLTFLVYCAGVVIFLTICALDATREWLVGKVAR